MNSDLDPIADPLASRELAAFVSAVESGTVRGAAEALSLTQSAATKRIQSLERRVGLKLLERGRSGVSPTASGRRLYPVARRALDALIAAERAIKVEDPSVILRLAASHTVGEFLLPVWLGEFRSEAPEIHPQVDVVNSPGVLDQLRAGAIDIGFVEGDDPLERLESMVVATDEIVIAVAADHPWTAQGTLEAKLLEREPYITRETGSGTRTVAESKLREVGVTLTPEVELASLEGVKRALPGGGFTLISRHAIETETLSKALSEVPVRGVDMQRELIAVRTRNRANGAGRHFWRFLEARTPL